MRDWHSIQYETQHRMATRTHDAALGHQGDGSFRLAVIRIWRGLIAGIAAAKAPQRMDDRSAPGYEAHRA